MNSQTTEEPSQLLNKAISNARNKTEEQRKVLEKRYASDVKAVRDNIDKTFAQHEKDAKELRKKQSERLARLLRRKMETEQKMDECVRRLQENYEKGCVEMKVVINNKLQLLEDCESRND